MYASVIPELKVSRVVFTLPSPKMGGYMRRGILQDMGLSDGFDTPPAVTVRALAECTRQGFTSSSASRPV